MRGLQYRGVDDEQMGYGPEGAARIVRKHAGGEMVSKAHFGADEKPMLNECGTYAIEIWTREDGGKTVVEMSEFVKICGI